MSQLIDNMVGAAIEHLNRSIGQRVRHAKMALRKRAVAENRAMLWPRAPDIYATDQKFITWRGLHRLIIDSSGVIIDTEKSQ